MMNNISSGKKQEEGGDGQEMRKLGASTSRQWGGLKNNPRIVRVSRAFGGKDRHSKVCTIRGLRDRRIRLSVPTAIQLYDLQDRLGLNQPSKVVDWLLDATKVEIDKLPPLHFPSSFSQHSLPPPHHSGKEKWIEDNNNGVDDVVVPQNFFPLGTHLMNINNNNNTTLPPYYHWEPSSLSLAQFHHDSLVQNCSSASVLTGTGNRRLEYSQNNLYLPPPPSSILPPPQPYMPPPTLPESTHFHHLLTTPSTSSSQHHHLIQNPLLIPPTLHFPIKSYAHNNPEKSSRDS